MNRTFLIILLSVLTFSANAQHPSYSPKQSAQLDLFLTYPESFDSSQLVSTVIDGETYIHFLMEVSPQLETQELLDLNVKIGTKAGAIWTALVPRSKILEVSNLQGVLYLELDRPVCMSMDRALEVTHGDSAHQGINLPHPLSGKGVVVGIVDAGFEYMHPTFYDTSGIKYRVSRIWEQKKSGTPPAGYSYGNEITDSNAMRDSLTDTEFSHGTHVGGIAAGSGFGVADDRTKGFAFESELVLVGIRPEENEWTSTGMASIIDGAKYVFDYAESVGKPAVVNLSWGGSTGANDGSSLFARALEAITGPGKIFVISAGNNGGSALHMAKSFTSQDTLMHSFQDFGFKNSNDTKRTWIDLWAEKDQDFCIQYALYVGRDSSNHSPWYCLNYSNEVTYLVGSDGDTCKILLSRREKDFNGKPHMLLDIHNDSRDMFSIKVKSVNADLHVWSYFVYEYVGYDGRFRQHIGMGNSVGDDKYSLGTMACANNAITVAAYSSRSVFTNISGQNISLAGAGNEGEITTFSSYGPTTNHRIKPNISSPGMVLNSGVSKHDPDNLQGGSRYVYVADKVNFKDEDFYYAYSLGTSMASPVVSGIVALMLEVNPELTPGLAMDIIHSTAIRDSFTTQNPDSSHWGYGKVNAYAAVLMALDKVSVEELEVNNGYKLYPNPAQYSFTIQSEQMIKCPKISVYSVKGEIVFEQDYANHQNELKIELPPDISSGMYLVCLSREGERKFFKLIVD